MPTVQEMADATEKELSSLMPQVRERILDRLRLAYWVGVADTREAYGLTDQSSEPVKQCPGCKMAIYDDAAKDGWCTDCSPHQSG